LFRTLFGESVEVTEELCLIHAYDFNFDWAACKLLSDAAIYEYVRLGDAAIDEYMRANDDYSRANALAFASAYIADEES
jgi:hypothetical protein